MNPTIRRYLLSSLSTFITGALIGVTAQLGTGTVEWTSVFWLGILIAAVRAGVKAVVEAFTAEKNS